MLFSTIVLGCTESVNHYEVKLLVKGQVQHREITVSDFSRFKNLAEKDSLFTDGFHLGEYGDMPIKSQEKIHKVQIYDVVPQMETELSDFGELAAMIFCAIFLFLLIFKVPT